MKRLLTIVTFILCVQESIYAQVFFTAAPNIMTGSIPRHVTSADFNNDGKMDLATANRSTNNISVFLGDGAGNFGAATNYITMLYPVYIMSADFNTDGKADIAVLTEGQYVSTYFGDGAGNFGAAANYYLGSMSMPNSLTSNDFNNDGILDLLVNQKGGVPDLLLLFGDALGGFSAPATVSYNATSKGITSADLNNDGNSDIITTIEFGFHIHAALGNGLGTFATTNSFPTLPGEEPWGLVAYDFNSDGNTDIATANTLSNDISILTGDGLGGFSAASVFSAGAQGPIDLAKGDFNNDGLMDLATANYDSDDISVLLSNGGGGFSAPYLFAVGNKPRSILSADFNNDGVSDIVIANEDSTLRVLLNVPPVCFPSLTINYSPYYSPISESQSWIMTSGTVLVDSGADVTLDAHSTSYVSLNPGFKAEYGAVFIAQAYNGCTPGAPQLPQVGKIANADVLVYDEIVLYPNPTTGMIHIKHDEKLKNIQIFDMVGKLVVNQSCEGETETNIDLSNLPNGVYHVKAVGYNSIKVIKKE